MLDIGTILTSIATSSAVAGAAAGAITFRFERRKVRWEWKREACLAALAVVDGLFANVPMTQNGEVVPCLPQLRPDIAEIRRCHNQLILSCKHPDVPRLYLECLGYGSDLRPGASIDDLRDAIRAECKLGKPLFHDRELSWIGRVVGAEGTQGSDGPS